MSRVAVVWFAVLLTACGGGSSIPSATARALQSASTATVASAQCTTAAVAAGTYQWSEGLCVNSSSLLKTGSTAAGAASTSASRKSTALTVRTSTPSLTATELFDWAEKTYPNYFPSHPSNLSNESFSYRYYPESVTALGVSLADNKVYAVGPATGNVLALLGDLNDFACEVYPERCAVPVVPLGSVTYTAAAPFSTVLSTSYAPLGLTTTNALATRSRYLISDAPSASTSANYLTIGATYSATAGYAVEAGAIASASTYSTYLTKLVQLVADATDPTCYRMDSHLHPNNAIDFDAGDSKLKFRNNFGKATVAYGYVCFTYDTDTHLLKATKRYNYSLSTYAHTADSSFTAANYYVKLQNGIYSLVSSLASATPLYFYTSPLDFSIPRDFNPGNTSFVTNAAAAFKTKSIVASVVEGANSSTYSKVNASYKAQVATAGTSSATKAAASIMLASIKAAVEGAGESLRYDTAVYTAFRDGLLASTLQSDSIADGVPGQNLVPYVFFTNEKDSSGKYHPFMVIVSYGNGGNPHGLGDIPRPPGDSSTGAGYGSQSVTRYSNLDSYTIGIPMKDYGVVTSVTENGLTPTLLSDTRVTPTAANATVYNYASTADNGIMITGAVMFPVYNNTLVPSQAMAELSAGGCHVGQGGGGPHCHADGYASSGILGVYTDLDYAGQTHPPLIGFGYDGVALFGRYRSTDSSLLGYATALDAWGGHAHGTSGYHYHADSSVTETLNGSATTYTIRSLIRGAYRGKTGSFPYPFGSRAPNNVYYGGL